MTLPAADQTDRSTRRRNGSGAVIDFTKKLARRAGFVSGLGANRTFVVRDPADGRCRALSLALARQGWTIAVRGRVDDEAAGSLLAAVWDAGGRVRVDTAR